jgi:assimilatory nitrate reductase catalytic subunit
LFRAASYDAVAPELLDSIETILNLQGPAVLHYADPKRGQRRSMHLQRVDTDTFLQGFMLAGDTRAQGWISALLQDEQPAQRYGRALLLAVSEPPVPVVSKGKVVCSCFNVRDVAIAEQLTQCSGSDAGRLAQLQSVLRCGTNCGSCLPELQRMVRTTSPPSSHLQTAVAA